MEFQHREIPLYYQLENILREKIRSGELSQGEKLPTENELIEQYGVSRTTVRQALAALVKEGILERVAGRGTFVKRVPSPDETIRLTGFIDGLSSAVGTRSEILDARFVSAPAKEAEALHIGPGDRVWRLKRIRYVQEAPYAYTESYLPADVGERLTGEDLSRPLLRLLEERGGIRLGEASAVIAGALADASIASVLSTKVGAPLLLIETTFSDVRDRPVQFVRGFYRSDLYRFKIHLTHQLVGDARRWRYHITSIETPSE
ncbi:MAG: GntR family transcriptional regulator [Acidobacteria bacterium]|nr:MAG: GntR family transcriptional regulator [Acidobacteriota bacterium]